MDEAPPDKRSFLPAKTKIPRENEGHGTVAGKTRLRQTLPIIQMNEELVIIEQRKKQVAGIHFASYLTQYAPTRSFISENSMTDLQIEVKLRI